MIKLLLVVLIFTNTLFSQSKEDVEQTRFEFPGYTLKGCLGSDLSKPQKTGSKTAK